MSRLFLILLLITLVHPAHAQEGKSAETKTESKDKKDDKKDGAPVTTNHEVTIGGKLIKYAATAGYIELPDYDGKPKANVFYVSYIKTPDEDVTRSEPPRPVMYCFNGGPGSSSVWLHLGCIGPKRVDFASPDEKPGEPSIPAPPYRVIDNEHSWLDLADLVFIDPVGTGYSRPVEGQEAKQFHGLNEDIQWVGDFIRLWTTKNKRWDSTKYLAGESYGTTRAAGLSGYLQDTHGMNISGIVFVSAVLNFQTLSFDVSNDAAYWLFLPTYAATAWYHKQLEPALQADLQKTLREVESFAATDYLLALARGDALSDKERDDIATRVARYTGLSKEFVLNSRLRINIQNFCKELLRDQARTVGRLDSRYKGIDRTDIGTNPDYDPSYAAIQGPFTATLNHYIRTELNYENDRAYEILTGRVQPWSYASATNRYASVAETLRSAMSKNHHLRVLFASGYYDLATPYFATEYTISHLGLDPTLKDNITHTQYECGHMMYIRHPDLVKLKADVATFMSRSAR
jgi:carboxypeptidase C (cathepsin A)